MTSGKRKWKKKRNKPRWRVKMEAEEALQAPPGALEIPWELNKKELYKYIDAFGDEDFWRRHQLVSIPEYTERGDQFSFLAVERAPREEMVVHHMFFSKTSPPSHIIKEYKKFRMECGQ